MLNTLKLKQVIFSKVTQTLNFTAQSKTLISLSLVIGTLFAFSLAPMSTVFALQNESNQTTQINQIQFEPSVDLQDVKGYLESRQFDNLKYASVTAELETNNYIIPLNIDYDLKDINKTIESYNNQKKAIVDGIRKSKTQPPVTKESIQEQNIKIADDVLKQARESEAINKKTKNNGSKNIIPSQADLDFVKENGYLPAPKVNKQEIEAKVKELGLPQEYVTYATDPQITGRLANARLEDREAVLTPAEKNDRAEKQADQKIQDDIVSQTDEMQLKDIEKTLSKVTSIKVSQLTYFTNVGDSNNNKAAKAAGKVNKKQGDKSDTAKVKSKSQTVQSSNQTKKPKLEDNVKQTVTQDITGQFKQSKEEEKKVKDSQEKDKQDYLQRAKTGKQQHNKIEQAMYAQEGIKVDAIEDTVVEPNKVGFVENLLNLGGLKAEAKGLNNAKYSLILYASQNTGLAFTFPSANSGIPGKLSPSNGTYGTQRFCFDNTTNQIKLAYGGECTQVYNLCLDDRESRFIAGDTVQLYICNGSYDQKWFFDEEGRVASLYNPGVCIDSYGALADGANLGLWTCHTGINQQYRAGYNNFGSWMGMTIWANAASWNLNCDGNNPSSCANGYNAVGHAFIEFWNNYGTHNTFSRWNFNDNNCNNNNGTSTNNICDSDKITVDEEIDIKQLPRPTKYNQFKQRAVGLIKGYWDYIVFGSGYRSNYAYWGNKVDLGGVGTYNGFTSQSRNTYYPAGYGIADFSGNLFNTNYVCSGQAVKLWNTAHGYDNISTGWYNGQPAMSPNAIYYQL